MNLKESWIKWAKEWEVDHLDPEHPDRKKAMVAWGAWARRQPNPDAYKNMAENDPNRLGAPKGWKGAI